MQRAEAVRLFKLDRIADLAVLDVPAQVPDEAEPIDVDAACSGRPRRTRR